MKQQVSQALAILLLLLMILGSVLFVLPLREKTKAQQVALDSLNTEVASLEQDYESLSALSQEVSSSEATRQALMTAVPTGSSQDTLILDLSKMIGDLGFTLNAMNFSSSVDEEFGHVLSITTNVSGSADKLVSLLQKLEASQRLLRVTSLNVQRTGQTSVAFNIHMEAYYQ